MTLDELSALCDVMVSLSKAGVPLDQGLLHIARDLPGRLGDQAHVISERLRRGVSLAEVVSSEENAFPPVYASVVEAGLRSGKPTAALEGFARLARQISELRRLVASALVYPIALMIVLTVISLTVLRQLPPTLHAFLDDHFLGSKSERNYDGLMATYETAANWFWVLPIGLLMVAMLWIVATRSASVAQPDRFMDMVRWVPGAARLLRNSRLWAFADVLQLLVQQQVPLHEAVRLAGSASGDRALRVDALALATEMERGQIVSAHQTKHGIPGFLRWGISHSGQIGSLEATLARACRMYRHRTEDAAMWVRTFLPAVFSVSLGGLVAIIYVAMFLVPWYYILRLLAEPLRLLS